MGLSLRRRSGVNTPVSRSGGGVKVRVVEVTNTVSWDTVIGDDSARGVDINEEDPSGLATDAVVVVDRTSIAIRGA